MNKRDIEIINAVSLILFTSALTLAGGIIMGNAWSLDPLSVSSLLTVISGACLVLAVVGFSLGAAFRWRATMKVVFALIICAVASMVVGLATEIPEAALNLVMIGSWSLAIIIAGGVRYIENLYKSVGRDIFR